MSVLFRKAESGDVILLQQLANTIWRNHYPGIISEEQIEYMLEKMYSGAVILNEIEKGFQWTLIMYDLQPIGFTEYHLENDKKIVKLSKLYVLTQYHKKGIGQAVLQYVKDQSKLLNAESLYLTVNKLNTKAIEAYLKSGFKKEREVVADIGNGYVMDDYIMSYSLSSDDLGL